MSSLKTTILAAVGGKVMADAHVARVDALSEHFRLIDIASEGFQGAAWQPAAKMKIEAGTGDWRTYTPLSIDASLGNVQVLAFLHGDGPGAGWASSVKTGDRTRTAGPRASLHLMDLAEPAVFFGDETSFAAAKTLQAHLAPSHATRLVFEISSTAEAKKVAERLELRDFEFFEKRDDGPHISGVARALQRSMDYLATPHLVLTGNGRSIQAVRGALRTAMNPYDWNAILCRDKAYWAPGKSNLD